MTGNSSAAEATGLGQPPMIDAAEFAERRARLAAAAAERGLAGTVVWSRGGASADWYGDVMYLANHHALTPQVPITHAWSGPGYAALFIPSNGGAPVLLTSTLDDSDGRIMVDDARLESFLPQAIGAVLRERLGTTEKVGLVGRETLLHTHWEELAEACPPGLRLEPADDLCDALRQIKSPAEIAMMRYAAAAGDRWMRATLAELQEGNTEADAAGAGIAEFIKHGGWPCDLALASGPNASFYWGSSGLPHVNTARPLRKGDLVHCDVWGPVNGYMTDFARSTVVGEAPSAAQAEVLEGAIGVVEAVVAAMKPGVSFESLFRTGEAWLAEHGFPPLVGGGEGEENAFGDQYPAFGHCLGLGNENPHIMLGETALLRPGMVVSAEAVVNRPQVGSAVFEHNVLITEEGTEVLTARCPSRWW